MTPSNFELSVAPWIPWPRRVEPADGVWALHPGTRLVPRGDELRAHAKVLAEELALATGIQVAVPPDAYDIAARPGDIVLRLDRESENASYRVVIGAHVEVAGRDLPDVAAGTATLLQALRRDGDHWIAPRCAVVDAPHLPFRSVMIDCARHTQSIDTLRQVVELCRLYKVRFVQLHLTDNEAFTFPSTRFPGVVSKHRHYTLDELHALEEYACARGVTLIPELDVPGHSAALVRARPDLFGLRDFDENADVVNMGREAVYAALDAIVGEMCAVFSSSSYFHIGGDEVGFDHVDDDPDVQAYCSARDVSNATELYRHFLARMHEIVSRHGKQTICWEGFGRAGKVAIPREIIVMAWEAAYYPPRQLLDDGFRVVNASWQPLYIAGGGFRPPHQAPKLWSPEHIYRWNPYRWEHFAPGNPTFESFQADPGERVLGAQMCVWEQHERSVVPTLRPRLAAFAERTWNPFADLALADFAARFTAIDALAERILRPVQIRPRMRAEAPAMPFDPALDVTMQATAPGSIHYTLDGTEPTADAELYEAPIRLTGPASVRAKLFDATTGRPRGGADWQIYEPAPRPRVRYRYYESPREGFAELPDFDAIAPAETGTLPALSGWRVSLPCGLVLESELEIPETGDYGLTLQSCDGIADLWIDGARVCARLRRGGRDGASATVRLEKGTHAFRVNHAQGFFNALCRVLYRGPGMARPEPIDPLLGLPD